MKNRPRVYFQVQPTVSHYREPLIRKLVESKTLIFHLVGRFSNSESTEADRIESAAEDVLSHVTGLHALSRGRLWWEKGQVSAVWRGGYDAFVLEGRIFTVSTWVAALAGRLRHRRVLLWGHGWKRPETGLKRRLRLMFYLLIDGLMVYGDQAKQLGVSYGVPSEKIAVVYNSLYSDTQLPADHQSDATARSDRATLIYSSRLTTRHRLDTLAEALHQWPQASVPRVIVVGDGAERLRLEQVFNEAGVDADFLGAIYDVNALKALYAQADAAVAIGGAGLNVIQALSFGVPVIAEAGNPDSSPEIEAVVEGETGRYFPAGDPESLRSVLKDTLGDEQTLRQMGRRGVELVRRRYTAERHAAALEVALHQFLGSP